jgi:hypothetical protein
MPAAAAVPQANFDRRPTHARSRSLPSSDPPPPLVWQAGRALESCRCGRPSAALTIGDSWIHRVERSPAVCLRQA